MQQSEAPSQPGNLGRVLKSLLTYDEANAMSFDVKAAIAGEEDAYAYPWGDYDDVPKNTAENM